MLLLSCWSLAVALCSRAMPQDAVARVLSVMGMITAGFLLFIIMTSNPFTRTLPNFPIDGSDLNPLLQDIGLIFHPPLLYMGYVGFSVAFAFAIASLMAGRLDTAWARWSRPWTTAAWVFLTLGIVLGSAWAYYELGWGGWWFWDPVENASFMPWLAGTALMHSLAVTEKRGTFKAWTVLLAITAFSLCLLGTFLVRSGVLVSVHSFASDPARGMFILAYLVIVIGGSLLLYAVKGGQVRSRVQHETFSRETFLLGNNVLLIAAMLVVLLGTLLPLVHKQLGLGSISIGEPFFNTMFTWLMAPLALLLGIGPLVRWRRDEPSKLWRRLGVALLATLVLSILLPWLLQDSIAGMTVVGLIMALWVIILTLMELHERATHRHGFWRGLRQLSQPLGHGARPPRRGGDGDRHRFQPELQRGARRADEGRRQRGYSQLSLRVPRRARHSRPELQRRRRHHRRHAQRQAGGDAARGETLLQRGAQHDDRSGDRRRFQPRSVRGAGRGAGGRLLGGTPVLQTLRALDLVRRRLYGDRRPAVHPRPALPHEQKLKREGKLEAQP